MKKYKKPAMLNAAYEVEFLPVVAAAAEFVAAAAVAAKAGQKFFSTLQVNTVGKKLEGLSPVILF